LLPEAAPLPAARPSRLASAPPVPPGFRAARLLSRAHRFGVRSCRSYCAGDGSWRLAAWL